MDASEKKHGPGICDCKIAEQCPYWESQLRSFGLGMNRGTHPKSKRGGVVETPSGDSRNLEMIKERSIRK